MLHNRSRLSPAPRHLQTLGLILLVVAAIAVVALRSEGAQDRRALEQEQVSSVETCPEEPWSSPNRIPLDAATGPVMAPTFSADGAGNAVVVGNIVVDWASRLPKAALFVRRIDGLSLGKPEGDFWFAYPRAVFDDADTLHLVWGEPEDENLGAENWALLPIRSLWHATYHPERGWSRAEEVFRHRSLFWSPALGTLGRTPEGGVHLVLNIRPDTLVYLKRNATEWIDRAIFARGASYTDAVVSRGGHILIGYIGSGEDEDLPPSAAHSVFVVSSDDGGLQWSPAAQIQLSTRGKATDLHLLGSPGGAVTLLWGQNRSGGLWPEAVRLVRSEDGGRTWSRPGDLEAAYGSLDASEWGRTVQVVWEAEGGPSEGRLMYSCWDGEWAPPRRLSSTSSAEFAPAFATGSGANLLLAWSRASSDSSASVVWSKRGL